MEVLFFYMKNMANAILIILLNLNKIYDINNKEGGNKEWKKKIV